MYYGNWKIFSYLRQINLKFYLRLTYLLEFIIVTKGTYFIYNFKNKVIRSVGSLIFTKFTSLREDYIYVDIFIKII